MLGKLIYYTKPKETVLTFNMNKIVVYLIFTLLFVIGFLIGLLGTERFVAILDKILAGYSFIVTVLLLVKSTKRCDEIFIYEYGIRGQGIDLTDKKSKILDFELLWKQVTSVELYDKGIIIKTDNKSYSLNLQKSREVVDIIKLNLLKEPNK